MFESPCLSSFPRAEVYARLRRSRGGLVREGAAADDGHPSERHLQCAWYEAPWQPGTLRTAEGEIVAVVSPGRWNLEAGPDFLDAVLLVGTGQRRIQGDIEVHVRARDWMEHGHDADPAYRKVAAHVTWSRQRLKPGILPPGCLQVNLAEAFERNPTLFPDAFDLTAYPYSVNGPDSPPCRAVLSAWTPQDIGAFLDAAGQMRLLTKSEAMRIASRRSGSDQALYEETAAALGYRNNAVPFRNLARRVPPDSLREEAGDDPARAYALLLGAAGLLPGDSARCRGDGFVRSLWDHWWTMRGRWDDLALVPEAWELAGLRPQNHPMRRLAALAALFVPDASAFAAIRDLPDDDPVRWRRQATVLLRTAARMDYWSRRLVPGGREGKPSALLGPDRAAAILANVVVPWLASAGRNVAPLLDALPAEQENSVTRRTAHLLFGRDRGPSLHATGLRRQGLIQVFRDFCLPVRPDCARCELPGLLRAGLE